MSSKDQSAGNEDLKAKMREALDRKKGNARASRTRPAPRRRRTAPRSLDGAPKMHRRKAGGGGS